VTFARYNPIDRMGDFERAEFFYILLQQTGTHVQFKLNVTGVLFKSEVFAKTALEMAEAFGSTNRRDWRVLGWPLIRATHKHPPREKALIRAQWRTSIRNGRPPAREEVNLEFQRYRPARFHGPPPSLDRDLMFTLAGKNMNARSQLDGRPLQHGATRAEWAAFQRLDERRRRRSA
jgi:hypothetical protein